MQVFAWFRKIDRAPEKVLPIAISACALLVSAGSAVWTGVSSDIRDKQAVHREDERDRRAAIAAEQSVEISDYQRVTDRFDSVAQAYAGLILTSGKVDLKSKNELLANLLEQDRVVQRVITILPNSKPDLIQAYRASVSDLSDSVQQVTGVQDMGPYWQNLNNLLVARYDLDQEIKGFRRAGLKS